MAGRNIVLATGEYYHVFNRGIARQPTFFSKRDYERFTLSLSYYRFVDVPVKLSRFLSLPPDMQTTILRDLGKSQQTLVEIISYVLMPNHFHLLVKQTKDGGITTFLSKTTNSYTRYVNMKQVRVGDLFQGVFKAVRVETEEQLIHLSRYIHINPTVSYLVKDTQVLQYPWSSIRAYLGMDPSFVSSDAVLSQFNNKMSYKQFLLDQIDYGKKLEDIKHLVLE